MHQITAWRISPVCYQDEAFSGAGAKEHGGRWGSVGTPLAYTSESLALATLELLVRVGSRRRLGERVCLPVTFREEHIMVRDVGDLPEGWDVRPYTSASQEVGDRWIASEASLVLRVPSVVAPTEYNYLINPLHPDFEALTYGRPLPLELDSRLLND